MPLGGEEHGVAAAVLDVRDAAGVPSDHLCVRLLHPGVGCEVGGGFVKLLNVSEETLGLRVEVTDAFLDEGSGALEDASQAGEH